MRLLRSFAISIAVAAAIFAAFDPIFDAWLPHFARLRANFSATYLQRELETARGGDPVVVLGDSVLWGYGVASADSAIGRIRRRRANWQNFAYPGGSPVNSLTMFRLLRAARITPRLVVFNVNQKTFNPLDSAFGHLHPAVEDLVSADEIDVSDERLLPSLPQTLDARLERAIGRFWHFYGMRADLRDALFDESDAATRVKRSIELWSRTADTIARAHRPKTADFQDVYDLTPLDEDNSSFRALETLARSLARAGVPALAVLTPTNHALLHDYIDDPVYRSNLRATRTMLRRFGVDVVDLDAAFAAGEFIDNDHLTAAGNARLAALLSAAVDERRRRR